MTVRLAILGALLFSSCSRKLPTTPAFLTLHVTAASCETLPMSTTGKVLGECRYTVENQAGLHVRRIEFRKAK